MTAAGRAVMNLPGACWNKQNVKPERDTTQPDYLLAVRGVSGALGY